MTMPPPSERELNRALCLDLDGSYERLVETFQHRLFAFAMQLSGSREDADEIVQDAFVRAYNALRTFPSERIESLALKPWLYRITLNLARNHHRYRASRVPAASLFAAESGTDDSAPTHSAEMAEQPGPEAFALRFEESVELETVLATLPDRYRIPVILRHVQGLTYPALAEVLNQPQGTVKANVHRGIRMLREQLCRQTPHLIAVEGDR